MVFVLLSIILNKKMRQIFIVVFVLFSIDDIDTNVLFSLLLGGGGFCLYESIGSKYN